jgi:hypothetical protein
MRKVITSGGTLLSGVPRMSLLGPDDFELSNKDRKKKLAKDLSPEVAKQIEKWLDRSEDPDTLSRLANLVGIEKAKELLAEKRQMLRDKDLTHNHQ